MKYPSNTRRNKLLQLEFQMFFLELGVKRETVGGRVPSFPYQFASIYIYAAPAATIAMRPDRIRFIRQDKAHDKT